jgi:hypothetical protein
MKLYLRGLAMLCCIFAVAGCSSSSSSSSVPSQAASASVRLAEGAPALETLIDGVPTNIGSTAYLQVDGRTVASSFLYGTFTPFISLSAGAHSLVVLDEAGFGVGPLAIPSLSGGGRYTLILVGSYPNYRVLVFDEPPPTGNAQLSLYEASPTVPQSDFGTFRASSKSDFKKLGTAKLGEIVTVSLGPKVSDIGGYVGAAHCAPSNTPTCITPQQINGFDVHNVLPFYNASRLSLFLFDPFSPTSGPGPLYGSLDQ